MRGVAYAVLNYTLALLTALAFALFVMLLPRGLVSLNPAAALAVDGLLMLLLGLQHSLMARPAFKRWLAQYLPQALERSTYLLATVAVLWVLMAGWRFWPLTLWSVEGLGAALMRGIQVAGVMLVIVATFQFDHGRFFGLRPAWERYRGLRPTPEGFRTPWLYRRVRHPMMKGFLLLLWAAPQMTADHLLLSAGLSLYIMIGLHYEEQDLRRQLGAEYLTYCQRVPAIVPRLWSRG